MSTSPTGSAADFELHKDFAWIDQARLVDESGQIAELHPMGFSERDRLDANGDHIGAREFLAQLRAKNA